MVVQTDLQFDPATAFHTYKIVYTVIKESLLVCFFYNISCATKTYFICVIALNKVFYSLVLLFSKSYNCLISNYDFAFSKSRQNNFMIYSNCREILYACLISVSSSNYISDQHSAKFSNKMSQVSEEIIT